MFGGLWAGFDTAEVPIGSVTNGVHGPTWAAREISALLGDPHSEVDDGSSSAVNDPQLWELRCELRRDAGRRGAQRGCARPGCSAARPRWSWAGRTPCSTRTC